MTIMLGIVCLGLVILLLVAIPNQKKERQHHAHSSATTPVDTHSARMGGSNSCGDSDSGGWFGRGGDHSCGGGDGGDGGGGE